MTSQITIRHLEKCILESVPDPASTALTIVAWDIVLKPTNNNNKYQRFWLFWFV